MAVESLESVDTFHSLVKGDQPILVMFTAPSDPASTASVPVFKELSDVPEHSGVLFMLADVEAHPGLAAAVQLATVPCFQLYRQSRMVSSVHGDDRSELDALVKWAVESVVVR
ncbi:thioredoxin family protein (plasmid) [Streptomyces anulatus]|uniref:thioredoxin family protein n=1 Tax=Streptomyces TaxID=1883 RepID=UPI000BFDECEE|nr:MULTISPECIES: thioredoxin family protein [Streptomyces]WSC66834.1 thioredoxin family protein [Streptomyces anulatus]